MFSAFVPPCKFDGGREEWRGSDSDSITPLIICFSGGLKELPKYVSLFDHSGLRKTNLELSVVVGALEKVNHSSKHALLLHSLLCFNSASLGLHAWVACRLLHSFLDQDL